ncbi:hypothetical protein OAT16_11110 [Prolixibacteraceae bacterium]|nr:hypothetical protein [Prolixibacteraceae bacterium]
MTGTNLSIREDQKRDGLPMNTDLLGFKMWTGVSGYVSISNKGVFIQKRRAILAWGWVV